MHAVDGVEIELIEIQAVPEAETEQLTGADDEEQTDTAAAGDATTTSTDENMADKAPAPKVRSEVRTLAKATLSTTALVESSLRPVVRACDDT